jgi:hypothetical protein
MLKSIASDSVTPRRRKERYQKSNNMKKTSIFKHGILLSMIFIAGCTSDFDEINTDPTKSSLASFDPNYLLSSSQWEYVNGTMGYNGPILFQSGWIQIFASTSSGGANYYTNMDKYVSSNNTNDYQGRSWDGCYRSASLANEMIRLTRNDPAKANLTAIATIIKVLDVHYITDMYGDAPNAQALNANGGVVLPVYDDQQTIYGSLLSELDNAINMLDNGKAKPSSDLFPYKGDVGQWKKFGYSLMLRMAMRLTKVDLNTAKTYAEKAANGTFKSSADDAYIICDNANGYKNDYARDLITPADFYQVRWSKKFIDYLKSTNDPRLGALAEVPADGLIANNQIGLAGNNDPSVQLGLPNGYDLNGGPTDITTSPGYPGGTGTGNDATPIGKYSRPRSSIYTNLNAPVFVLTYAQTELLLAEAAVRNFNVGGTATVHYRNAVEAALLSLAPYGTDAVIPPGTATAYAAANPLDVSSAENSLKMINEQYWATAGSQFNFSDAWNNWKRSGYPVLTPVVYSGNFSGGVIPRRQPYPTTEGTLNPANYQTAVGRLSGGDKWSSKVWWDK